MNPSTCSRGLFSYKLEPMQTGGFQGMSQAVDGGALIIVNEGIENAGRKKFTGAHEIGHVVLHIQNGIKNSFKCTKSDFTAGTKVSLEREANEFASSLIMPKAFIAASILQNELSWKLIQSIKNKCDTSLEATARRVIKLSDEVCALIIHKDGQMWTPIKSRLFKSSKFFINESPFPKCLETLPDLPLESLPDYSLECSPLDWEISGKDLPDSILYSSIRNEEHDRTMTLLIIPEVDEEDAKWEEPTF